MQPSLVSRLSAPLDALIRSGVTGPDGCCVNWDIDIAIFYRLVQFIFTGSYTSPVGKPDENLWNDVLPKPRKAYSCETFNLPYSLASFDLGAKDWRGGLFWSHVSHPPGSDCGPSEAQKLRISTFMSTYINAHRGPLSKDMPGQFAEEALIFHARMWAFADDYAIKSLVEVASSRLAYELAHWTISAATFVPIFSHLVHHAYVIRKTQTGGLRQLVASYAVCVGEQAADLDGWEVLLMKVPAFTCDLAQQMMGC